MVAKVNFETEFRAFYLDLKLLVKKKCTNRNLYIFAALKKTIEMKLKDEYAIQFPGLALGRHEFDWKIEDKFFEAHEFSDIKKADLKVRVVLEKKSTFLDLDFFIDGTIGLECDRCTVGFDYQIDFQEKLIVKFFESQEEVYNDEIIVLGKNENVLQLTELLYEFVVVQVPIRKVGCEIDGDESLCDQDVLKLIENLSPKSENSPTDPRWDKLSGIDLN